MGLCFCPHITEGDRRIVKSKDDPLLLRAGEVRAIQESVFTPCFDILADHITKLPDHLADFSNSSLRSIKSKKRRATHKTRPCIILNEGKLRPDNTTDAEVCLLATFEKTPMTELPKLFRHFCVPIVPHDDVPTPNKENHLHSMPYDWSQYNTWAIAWRLKSTRAVDNTWVDFRLPEVSEWYFGRRAIRILMRQCDERRDAWDKLCDNRQKVMEIAHEFSVRSFPLFIWGSTMLNVRRNIFLVSEARGRW